jgi:hypothetical protein
MSNGRMPFSSAMGISIKWRNALSDLPQASEKPHQLYSI